MLLDYVAHGKRAFNSCTSRFFKKYVDMHTYVTSYSGYLGHYKLKRHKYIRLEKSSEKTHDSWINSYFSASERPISMRFSIFSSSIFLHSQNYKRFAIQMIKIRIEIFEFKKIHFSKWLNLQLKMFVLRKGTVQIGQKCVESLSKRLIYISYIVIQLQIGLFLEISEAGTFCRSKMR